MMNEIKKHKFLSIQIIHTIIENSGKARNSYYFLQYTFLQTSFNKFQVYPVHIDKNIIMTVGKEACKGELMS